MDAALAAARAEVKRLEVAARQQQPPPPAPPAEGPGGAGARARARAILHGMGPAPPAASQLSAAPMSTSTLSPRSSLPTSPGVRLVEGPTPHDSSDERGCVATLLDAYGFVRLVGRAQDVFFHFSQVSSAPGAPPLPAPGTRGGPPPGGAPWPIAPGDVVTCRVTEAGGRSRGKLSAVQVTRLAAGETVSFEDAVDDGGEAHGGVVARAPGGGKGPNGRGAVHLDAATAGAVGFPEGYEVSFGLRDVTVLEGGGGGPRDRPPAPRVGDRVSLLLMRHKGTGVLRATEVRVIEPAAPPLGQPATGRSDADSWQRSGAEAAIVSGTDAATPVTPGNSIQTAGGRTSNAAATAPLPPGPPLGSEDEVGVVVQVRDTFGFVRCLDRNARLFFHFSAIEGWPHRPTMPLPRVGDALAFVVARDARTDKLVCARVRSAPENAVSDRERLVAVGARGRVSRASGSPAEQGIDDGRLDVAEPLRLGGRPAVFSAGSVVFANLATADEAKDGADPAATPANAILAPGDDASFDLWENERLGLLRATNVCRRVVEREVGRVTSIKDKFGFLQSLSSSGDLFFHASFLEPPLTLDQLRPGTAVEFTPAVDPKSGKPAASRVSLAPEGVTVAFNEVSSEIFYGRIMEPAHPGKGYGTQAVVGLIEYVVASDGDVGFAADPRAAPAGLVKEPPADLPRRQLPYHAPGGGGGSHFKTGSAVMRAGEHVAFRISRDLRAEARAARARATGSNPGSSAPLAAQVSGASVGSMACDVRLIRTRVRLLALFEATGVGEVVEYDCALARDRETMRKRADRARGKRGKKEGGRMEGGEVGSDSASGEDIGPGVGKEGDEAAGQGRPDMGVADTTGALPPRPAHGIQPGGFLSFHVSELSFPGSSGGGKGADKGTGKEAEGASRASSAPAAPTGLRPGDVFDGTLVTSTRTGEVTARRLVRVSEAPADYVAAAIPEELRAAAQDMSARARPLLALRQAQEAEQAAAGGTKAPGDEGQGRQRLRLSTVNPSKIAAGPDGTRGFGLGRGRGTPGGFRIPVRAEAPGAPTPGGVGLSAGSSDLCPGAPAAVAVGAALSAGADSFEPPADMAVATGEATADV